jgi:hypothetical protein
VLDKLRDRLDERGPSELAQLRKLGRGIDPLGQHGEDETALELARHGIRLALRHSAHYAR